MLIRQRLWRCAGAPHFWNFSFLLRVTSSLNMMSICLSITILDFRKFSEVFGSFRTHSGCRRYQYRASIWGRARFSLSPPGGFPAGLVVIMYQRWYQLLVSCSTSTNVGIITHTRPINCETTPRSRSVVKNRAHTGEKHGCICSAYDFARTCAREFAHPYRATTSSFVASVTHTRMLTRCIVAPVHNRCSRFTPL